MKSRLKVLIIPQATNNKNGGIMRHCYNLYELMLKDNDIIPLEIPKLKTKYCKLLKKAYYDKRELEKVISSSGCDLVHIHGLISLSTIQAIDCARKYDKKIIYSPHYHPFKYLEHPVIGKLFFKTFIKPRLKYITHIVTISETDKNFFGQIHHNVKSIPHHYTTENLNEISLYKSKNKILFVGRNEPNKGLDMLYGLPCEYEVHCVTKGPLERADFILHENISDEELEQLYSKCDLVVVPSRYEAFSYVAMESLIKGTPVVISDRVEIGSYIKDMDGVGIFEYNNFEDFMWHIRHTIGTKVDRSRMLSIFSPEKIREAYHQVYCSTYYCN